MTSPQGHLNSTMRATHLPSLLFSSAFFWPIMLNIEAENDIIVEFLHVKNLFVESYLDISLHKNYSDWFSVRKSNKNSF